MASAMLRRGAPKMTSIMMKVYGTIASPHVARVVLVARHKNLPLAVEWPAGGLKSAAYLAMNPMGRMPVLEHDGQYVIESEVICQYLEDLFPAPTILPGDAHARARARTVSRVVDLYFWPDLNQLLHQLIDPTWLDAAPFTAAFISECDAATDAYLANLVEHR